MDFSSLYLFQAFQSRLKDRKPNTQELSNLVSSETWATMSSSVASMMFAWAIVCQYSPYEVRGLVDKLKLALRDYLDRHVTITFHETSGERMKRGEAYSLVEAYLASKATHDSKRLRAEIESDSSELSLSMDDYQEVTDVFRGVKFVWSLRRVPESRKAPYYEQGRRFYEVVFNRRHRAVATGEYLGHVMRKGRDAKAQKRRRRLYTNSGGGCGGRRESVGGMWSHVAFEHPAKLENMALEPAIREDIMEDLMAFSGNREFYERAGRAWKRGYLLYGPPGTGKSTMVAAMANLLNYDVYDLELTAVRDNTELRRLLIDTSSKSIIVIEDIDCSLDLTGQRSNGKQEIKPMVTEEESSIDDGKPKKARQGSEEASRVTLSGLLNVIDGIWSSCGSERLIVFTTNHVEKLDPALIRSGRMDKHIELSYCTFEGFKVLAKNYLGVESHPMFDEIEGLIREVEITPADLAESLIPRSHRDGAERCLLKLVQVLQKAKKKTADETVESVKTV